MKIDNGKNGMQSDPASLLRQEPRVKNADRDASRTETAACARTASAERKAEEAPFRKRLQEVVRANRNAGKERCGQAEPEQQDRAQCEEAPKRNGTKVPGNNTGEHECAADTAESKKGTSGQTAEPVEDADVLQILPVTSGVAGEEDALTQAGDAGPEVFFPVQNAETAQAVRIIQTSIVTVSRSLNIRISSDVEQLDFRQVTESTVNDLAEIIRSLKGIADIMDTALAQNGSVEIGGRNLTGDLLKDLENVIRSEVFRIQYAVRVIGIAQQVTMAVAQKEGRPVTAGIPVAVDPSTRSMPSVQLEQILGGKTVAGQDANGLLERLASVLRSLGSEDVGSRTTMFVRRVFSQAQSTVAANVEPLRSVGNLDPQLMRSLLRLDVAEASAAQNGEAAGQNARMDLPKSVSIGFGRSLSVEAVQIVAQEGGAPGAANETVAAQVATTSRLAGIVDGIEESVVRQVVEKFNQAVKTGVNEMRILLRPESLGEVRLKISVEGDVVMARIHVENQQVKQIIENNLGSLRNALAEHNLQTGSFSVDVGGSDSDPYEQAQAGTAGTHADDPDDRDTEEAGEQVGTGREAGETGRRFGSNTVEYFA